MELNLLSPSSSSSSSSFPLAFSQAASCYSEALRVDTSLTGPYVATLLCNRVRDSE